MRSILENRLFGRLRGGPRRVSGKTPVGTIWPDGTFSLGFKKTEPDDDSPWYELHPAKEMGPTCPVGGKPEATDPLNLGNAPNSHSPPKCPLKPRGSKGITGLGRKMIRSGGALINRDKRYDRSTFCTITIPTLPQEARVRLVQNWPELVRQLIQRVTRQLIRAGLPPIVLSVTEVQPKRLEKYGEAYPHLHLLWVNPVGAKKGAWAVDVSGLKVWLHKTISRLADYPLEHLPNTTVIPVKGSVAAYMSKYMSKGDETVSKARKDWGGYTISQWWNMSKAAKDWVLANKKKGYKTGLLLETALHEVWESSDFSLFIWFRHVEISYNSGIVTVGWRGCLTDAARRDLTAMLQSD